MKKFKDLGLESEIIKSLEDKGFTEPSEIQEKAIPLALAGKDIIGGSATGSGKTFAFAASIIQQLKPNGNVQTLVLTPTRELAMQVADEFKTFSKYKELYTTAVYGGVGIEPQIKKIRDADIVVATPGRILDHIERGTLDLSSINYLVLDEVDRMFDMGFYQDVEKILKHCPKDRQTMLFSATISNEIDHLTKKYTQNPETVAVSSFVDRSKLEQIYYDVETNKKFSLLVHLLKNEDSDLVMVFCGTRRTVDFVASNLNRIGVNAHAIHGGQSQHQRGKVMKRFSGNGATILVCTDVAGRGIDIKDVSHVYNYDLPNMPEDYVHRIGRTARAGEEGKAIILLSNRDYQKFDKIIENEELKIEQAELPEFEKIDFRVNDSRGGGGRDNRRGGGRDNRRGGGRDNRRSSGGDNRRGGRDSRRSEGDNRRGGRDNRRSSGGDNRRGGSFRGRREGGRSRDNDSSGRSGNSSRDRRGGSSRGRDSRKAGSRSYGRSSSQDRGRRSGSRSR